MKVLFIYPNKVMVTRVALGIGYLSSRLKSDGHTVKLFDTSFIKCCDTKNDEELRESSLQVKNPDFAEYGISERAADPFSEFESEVASFRPDMVALSIVDPNYNFGIDLLKSVKKRHKNILTVVGGPTATFAPDDVIAHECVDIVCIGEGEDAMSELCGRLERGLDIKDVKNMWVKRGGSIFRNEVRPLPDIDGILPPDWSIFDERHLLRPMAGKIYRTGIFVATRGCLFRCKYCGNLAQADLYKGKGSYYRVRSPKPLVDEIAEYKRRFGLEFVFFVDDLFPLHIPDVIDEFSALYKERVGLPFSVNLHPALLKEEQFAKIVKAGCRNACIGLESGDPTVRKEMLGRVYDDEVIINAFRLAHKYKVRCSSFNMIGIPRETRKDIFKTIELNRRANPTTTTLTFLHPYRGTELRNICISERLYDPSREREYESVYRDESCLSLPQISRDELKGIFKTFQLYFKLPKYYRGFIKMAEGGSPVSTHMFNVLKRLFYRRTKKEFEWDFRPDPAGRKPA